MWSSGLVTVKPIFMSFLLNASSYPCSSFELFRFRNVNDEAGLLPGFPVLFLTPLPVEPWVKVPARDSEPARQATVIIHNTIQSTLQTPDRRSKALHPHQLPAIDVSLVRVTAVNPSVDASPLQWLLITNVEVTNFADAIYRISMVQSEIAN